MKQAWQIAFDKGKVVFGGDWVIDQTFDAAMLDQGSSSATMEAAKAAI